MENGCFFHAWLEIKVELGRTRGQENRVAVVDSYFTLGAGGRKAKGRTSLE